VRNDGTDPLPRVEGPGGGSRESHAAEMRGADSGERKRKRREGWCVCVFVRKSETTELTRFPELRDRVVEVVNHMLRKCVGPTQVVIYF